MANFRTTMRLLQGVRQLSTTSAKQAGGEVHPGYFKLKAVQESFQKKDGLPVHLKGGAKDKVLFGITVALIGYGFFQFGEVLYKLSYPQKPAE